MRFVLTDFDLDEWFQGAKNSQGSSIGVSYNDTSPESKFTWPISMTESVKPLYDAYMQFDPQLDCAVKKLNSLAPIGEMYNIVEGSRATTVEKNDEIRRQIAVEPTGNMFFQLGLMEMLYRRMKVVGLDVSSLPTEHVDRARLSSITGQEATIDFSSASDCVSIKLLKWLLPPKWFDAVNMVRSPKMSVSGNLVDLNMVSTMGNAGTFPLMTLTLWTLGHAIRLASLGTYSSFPEWDDLKVISVFGDDCIVPSDLASDFIAVAEYVGFIVNKEKSFIDKDDKFRESCGGDFLTGYNVRPYYLRAPTSTRLSSLEPWLYSIGNGLLKKYRLYFGDLTYLYEKQFFEVLFKLFRRYNIKVKVVPDDMPADSGLKISDDLERFCSSFQITFSEVRRSDQGTYSFNYCRFIYKVKMEQFDELRYALWLKTPTRFPLDQLLRGNRFSNDVKDLALAVTSYSIGQTHEWEPEQKNRKVRSNRRIGGYVVARAITSHWGVPGIRHLRRPQLVD